MLEAKIAHGNVLKKIIESIKDLVQEANFDFSPSGISLQSMDNAHVTLVMLLMRADGFENYRCDRSIPVGINVSSLAKVIKSAGNEDAITIRCSDDGETISFMFESPTAGRVCEYELKLMDLDVQQLGVPQTDYDVQVRMSSAELARICRDLLNINDTVTISAAKDTIRFTAKGELGTGSVLLSPSAAVDSDTTGTTIILKTATTMDLSLKFLSAFTKASPLSETVNIGLSEGIPALVEYPIGDAGLTGLGYLRFYLAPKMDDEG